MRRQRVPRKVLTDDPKKKLSLAEYFAQGRAYAAETASTEALHTLDELAKLYEARHDIKK